MGVCGQYIDAISDTQRDRIIEGKDFGDGWSWVSEDDPSCRCLVGHAENYGLRNMAYDDARDARGRLLSYRENHR